MHYNLRRTTHCTQDPHSHECFKTLPTNSKPKLHQFNKDKYQPTSRIIQYHYIWYKNHINLTITHHMQRKRPMYLLVYNFLVNYVKLILSLISQISLTTEQPMLNTSSKKTSDSYLIMDGTYKKLTEPNITKNNPPANGKLIKLCDANNKKVRPILSN